MKLLDAALQAAVRDGVDAFGGNFKNWCAVNNIARSTAYRHRARVQELGHWEAKSNRPKTRAPHATPAWIVHQIVDLRSDLSEAGDECGADQIRYQLQLRADREDWRQHGLLVPSRATIHKIIAAHGMVSPEPRKRPKSSFRRFVYGRPRDCYQIDATEIVMADAAKAVVFEVLDDHSRVLVSTHACDAETAAGAVAAIQRAFDDFGVPALVLSDNGTAFTTRLTTGGRSRFTRHVTAAGARLIHSSPYHPQTCGKVERHHRTFKQWLTRQTPPTSLDQLQSLGDHYQHWYNTQRRHSAHDQPPADTWQQAPHLGGPTHPPIQDDASVHHLTISDSGCIVVTSTTIGLGRHRARQHVTAIRDHDHVTIYQADGQPIGHLTIDPTKTYQTLRPAA